MHTLREAAVTDELAAYDYSLPESLIAHHPAHRREDARLLIVDRSQGTLTHSLIGNLPEFLRAGDCLVLNDTRVVPARLLGHRVATGGRWEGLFLEAAEDGSWQLLSQCRGKLQPGEQIEVHPAHTPESPDRLVLVLEGRDDEGIWRARPSVPADVWPALERFGTVPLPPYMRRELAAREDFERYQTVYARHHGSVAAPTAGLHFTPDLLERCSARGVDRAFVTLHVGIGTFRPIAVEHLSEHRMHSEWSEVGRATVEQLERATGRGGRRVVVGTTTARALESAAAEGRLSAHCGSTNLFIRPPYQFRVVDCLLTNFHLPRSTLLVMVSTLAGRELMREAYAAAIREQYRFFSYGDAMLIL
jgi:S-adenosylmethionine:tRNA ribosyltransferase-isomerase